MTDTEELIKAALAKQVERTPHAGPILHALSKPRHRSWRGLVVIIVAILVTGGIAVPVAMQSSPDQLPPAPLDPPPGTPMSYTVSHLPTGYVETERLSDEEGDSQIRMWQKGESGLVHLMALGPGHRDLPKCLSTPSGADQPSIIKAVNGWCVELVTDESVSAAERQRIADSIQPDGQSVLQSPVRFGRLPAGLVRRTVSVSSGPVVKVKAGSASGNGDPGFELTMGPGERLGELDVPKNVRDLIIERDLGAGQVMRVHFSDGPGAFTPQQREEIVRDIKVEPVDLTWLGK
jgi:hypothetical protein